MFQHREKQFQAVYIHASLETVKLTLSSVSDPDWIRIQLGQRIRIRNQAGQNWLPKKGKKGFNFMFEESYVTVFEQNFFPNYKFLKTNFVIINLGLDPDPDWVSIWQQARSRIQQNTWTGSRFSEFRVRMIQNIDFQYGLVYRLPNFVLTASFPDADQL